MQRDLGGSYTIRIRLIISALFHPVRVDLITYSCQYSKSQQVLLPLCACILLTGTRQSLAYHPGTQSPAAVIVYCVVYCSSMCTLVSAYTTHSTEQVSQE